MRERRARRLPRWQRRLAMECLETRDLLAVVPLGFTETEVARGLTSPTTLDIAPDGRVFIAFQDGTIRVAVNDVLQATPFVTLACDGAGEHGLEGLELDPNFSTNGYLYVFYTATTPESHHRVSRLQANPANPNVMLAGSETILLELPNFSSLPENPNPIWHMGGAIHVAPDGTLRVQVGDQLNTSLVQNMNSPFGKILRLNRDGSVPADNPFFNAANGITATDYIWALGLRNPFSGDIDPVTGRYYVGDVGAGDWEEIDDATLPGRNFGWPTTEGDFNPATFPNFTRPVFTYAHTQDCAITGGVFYRAATPQFPASYNGVYFFSEFCAGVIQFVDPNNLAAGAQAFATGAAFPLNLEVSPDGALYYIERGAGAGGNPGIETGRVVKIQHVANVAPSIVEPPASTLVSQSYPATFSVSAQGSAPLAFQWQRKNTGATSFTNVAGATGSSYTLPSATLADTGAQFRVVVTNSFGTVTSNAATLTVTTNLPPVASITSPTAATLFQGGDVIAFAGGAFDPETGALAAAALTWWIDFHHDTHSHPFLPLTSGVSGGQFTVPVASETDPDVYYRIHLRAVDAIGLAHETTFDVLPRLAELTLATSVPGLSLMLDNQSQTAPFTLTGVANLQRSVSAPAFQSVAGQTYRFVSWSDGGAAAHSISFPATNSTLTALYELVTVTYVSNLPFSGTPVNGWGPVERDKSNGENGTGDGGAITLNGVAYSKGLGVHANSEVRFALAGGYSRFLADVGLDDEKSTGTVVFRVYGDGVLLHDSGVMSGPTPTKSIDVSVTGVNELRLVVNDGGDSIDSDHGDWADAKLVQASTPPPTTITYLSDLAFSGTPTNGWGPVERDKSNAENVAGDGRTITLNGVTYTKGLGAHANSDVRFALAGAYSRFVSDVGLDDEIATGGTAVFRVLGDGVVLYDSGVMTSATATKTVDVSVAGVNELRLVIDGTTDGVDFDHGDWAGAKLLSSSTPAAGVTVTQSGGSTAVTEGGATDSYTVVLTSQPTANVTVSVAGGTQVSTSPASLVFTAANWNTPQTVTVTAVNDAVAEGAHTGTITHSSTSTDTRYQGIAIPSATASITDNDAAGVTISQSGGSTAVAEGGTTDSYTVVLTSQPTANVTVSLAAGTQVSTSPTSLVFTTANWNTPQTVTVTAVNDAVAEGAHTGAITHSATSSDTRYQGIAIASVTASLTDNDTAGVTITQSGGSTAVTEGGATDSYTVVLTSQPTANVTVSLAAGTQLTALPTSLVFTAANWNTPQTVTVTAVNDLAVEGTHSGAISHTAASSDARYQGIAIPSVTASITDNDVAASDPFLRTGTVTNVTSTWQTITLDRAYASMVVVATVNYTSTSIPLVARVRNAAGNSFQLQVDRTDQSTASFTGVTVRYMVVEEGVYTLASSGVKLEAVKFTSTVTDRRNSYNGTVRTYANSYTQPVVLGQVMSANDANWSVFWARGSSATVAPSSTVLRVGKHVGEDPVIARANETIGYIVLEAGAGTLSGVGYSAQVGGTTLSGVGNSPPYAYTLLGFTSVTSAIVSQAGMRDNEGGWPILYGTNPVSTTRVNLAIDEDAALDSERRHSTERAAYVVFGVRTTAATLQAAPLSATESSTSTLSAAEETTASPAPAAPAAPAGPPAAMSTIKRSGIDMVFASLGTSEAQPAPAADFYWSFFDDDLLKSNKKRSPFGGT